MTRKKTPSKKIRRKTKPVADGKQGLSADQQQQIIDQQAALNQMVLVPVGVVTQLVTALGQLSLKLGGLATLIESNCTPIGPQKEDGKE